MVSLFVRVLEKQSFSNHRRSEGLTMAMQAKTLEDLWDIAQQLVLKVDALVASNEKLLSRIAIPARTRPEPDLSLLTEQQRQILTEIDAIRGNDVKARNKAQALLLQLAGQKVSEAMAIKTKEFLKQRGWGVRCTCGAVAQLHWQKNRQLVHGGLLGFSHSVKGYHEVHGSRTTLRELELVPKPDKRTQRPERK